jgi:hypothetical protein
VLFANPKVDGDWLKDFRQLNLHTKKMEWPLPNIEHAVNSKGGSSIYKLLYHSSSRRLPRVDHHVSVCTVLVGVLAALRLNLRHSSDQNFIDSCSLKPIF